MNKLDQFLLKILEKFPEGGTVRQIIEYLEEPIGTRTVQRHLQQLVSRDLLQSTGKTRSKKYFLAAIKNFDSKFDTGEMQVSKEGEEIRAYIQKALTQREVVSYQFSLLEKYEPNITFYLEEKLLAKLNALGESENQNQPAGTLAQHIYNRLLIDLSYNSSRLEGNTYSLLDTEYLINYQKTPAGKGVKETQMVLNHKAAIEYLVRDIENIKLNSSTLLNLHSLLSDNLLPNSESCGRLRLTPVEIYGSSYKPIKIPQVIEEQFHLILSKASKIQNPYEQSFFLLIHLPYLQPFEDVNKRVSRLAANIPLFLNNKAPLSFVEVPEKDYIEGLLGIYELNRIDLFRDLYVWAYEKSSRLYKVAKEQLGEPDPFRLQYRKSIAITVHEVVAQNMSLEKTSAYIENQSRELPSQDQFKFREVVEKELISLHEGNIVRYKLTAQEYQLWRTSF